MACNSKQFIIYLININLVSQLLILYIYTIIYIHIFVFIGGILSPRNSDTPSLTESMQMVDEILSDGRMDRFEKIEKLEAILSAVTGSATDQFSSSSADVSPTKCVCSCQDKNKSPQSDRNSLNSVACQTYSTGDIVITKIFLTEEEKERIDLLNSPKK